MIPAFEMKIREASLEGYEEDEITATDVTIKMTGNLYTKLVEAVRNEMVESAFATIDWQMHDPEPVVDVSFKHLESVRFKLEPLLEEVIENGIETIHARDALASMLEKTAASLRKLDDEYFEQFYDPKTGRSGTDPL